ncbi:hypothetical protein [Halomonas rhizosphaerae]|uniref:DUF2570 domain-containing protein n=1 Tax=Halomonas rhizosphaerae TaxID=3043296 RepID=A0ABT6UXC0_9GAMM|nr:hypothetical protein [Halomonas rhizosphaerae]MDI5890618.1 hypothetical protein [Halomonas rhizosphaerae]
MSRLWGWIAAGFAILAAGLLYMTGQRDKAREQAKQARVSLQASQASREVDAAARKAQEQARTESAEVQREADDRPEGQRPSGHLRR